MAEDPSRFQRAIEAFDARNAADPRRETLGDRDCPRALLDAIRLSLWLERRAPDASEPLRLAARCQHLERWRIPRTDYPEGRTGYYAWRTALARFHADQATEILTSLEYDADTIERVRSINLKQGLRTNPEVQIMEDALCLAFLAHEAEEFSVKHPDEKLLIILGKTWSKLSPRGKELALQLELSPRLKALLEQLLKAAR